MPIVQAPEPPELERRHEPVVGYRAWSLDADGFLHALAWPEYIWAPGQPSLQARCMSVSGSASLDIDATPPKHPAPDWKCQCGFWSLANPLALRKYIPDLALPPPQDTMPTFVLPSPRKVTVMGDPVPAPVVGGAIMAWGLLIQHAQQGYRAEYVRPLALLDHSSLMIDWAATWGDRLRIASERYGIPLLGWKHLIRFATEFGSKLPS